MYAYFLRVFFFFRSAHITGSLLDLNNLSYFADLISSINKKKNLSSIKIHGNFDTYLDKNKTLYSVKEDELLKKHLNLFQSITSNIENSSITYFCYVDGIIKGPALEFALACKNIEAGPNTYFEFNEIDQESMFLFGSIQRLLRVIGYKNTLDLLLFKKRLNFEEASKLELINSKLDLVKKKQNFFWDQQFTNTFIYYNSKIHAKTKNLLPAYNATLSSVFEGTICGYEASLSIEKKWLNWLINKNCLKSSC